MWGCAFSLVDYLAGNAFERFVGKLHHGARLWWIVAGLVALGLIAGGVHWWRSRSA